MKLRHRPPARVRSERLVSLRCAQKPARSSSNYHHGDVYCGCVCVYSNSFQLPHKFSAAMAVKAHRTSIIRKSSLFTLASFSQQQKKKDTTSTSVFALRQETNAEKRRAPRLIFENTYQLEPYVKFESEKVKPIINSVLESNLKDEVYDHTSLQQMVLTLTEIIKNRVKDLNYQRYKIVCMVSIGELKNQGLRMGSRCCWDAKWDTFAMGSFTNKNLFATGIVWGVYYE